jgi:LacI family gluconate utilization system Gnt-I transcriptional repressor
MVIPNISGPIFANTIQTFSDTLNRHGYQLLLASSYFSAKQEENAVRRSSAGNPPRWQWWAVSTTARRRRCCPPPAFPVVETWDYQPRRKPIQVGYSNNSVGEQAARYLYAKAIAASPSCRTALRAT